MLTRSITQRVADVPNVGTPIPVADYLPHKMEDFVPYDRVVPLHTTSHPWTTARVREQFDAHDVTYDAIYGVGPNDSTADGERLAFVRFRSLPTQ